MKPLAGVRRTSFSLVAALVIVMAPAAAWACCAAARAGEVARIADQEVLVTWDPATKVEHFVRRAAFDTGKARDFGFFVPTPTEPALAEADAAGFDRLAELAKPVHVTRYVPTATIAILAPFMRSKSEIALLAVAATAVRVLHEQRVAGYDAVVLEADDAKALTDWLAAHGYDARPQFTDWVQPYVVARWKVTAFKFVTDAAAERVQTGSVRMTFKTDRPLFPYRVPSDNRSANGLLRVFFVGSERVRGSLGTEGRGPWASDLRFSNEASGVRDALAGVVPTGELPAGTWLSVFEDHMWPGGAEDLYFRRLGWPRVRALALASPALSQVSGAVTSVAQGTNGASTASASFTESFFPSAITSAGTHLGKAVVTVRCAPEAVCSWS